MANSSIAGDPVNKTILFNVTRELAHKLSLNLDHQGIRPFPILVQILNTNLPYMYLTQLILAINGETN